MLIEIFNTHAANTFTSLTHLLLNHFIRKKKILVPEEHQKCMVAKGISFVISDDRSLFYFLYLYLIVYPQEDR